MAYLGIYPTNWAGYTFKAPLGYTSGLHTGVDYNHGTNDEGYRIYAIASGVVAGTKANGQVRGFGNALIIKTKGSCIGGANMYHRYLHARNFIVTTGQRVKAGEVIGYVGKTGTTAFHLHLDLWHDGNGLGTHWDYHKNTALSSYADPYRTIVKNPNWDENQTTNQGEHMITSKDINTLRIVMSEVEGWNGHNVHAGKHDKQIMGTWYGKSWTELINHSWKVQPVHRIHLTEQLVKIEKLLANEKAKPAVEVIKEVDPSWLVKVRDFINNFLGRNK